jgi:23S rRNA-/tRNA-specific pseudouridylate synthase
LNFISRENSRVERFLSRETGAPRSFFLKLLRKGKVSINGIKSCVGARVNAGDEVWIEGDVISEKNYTNKILDINIYESNDFFLTNKPYNICSQQGKNVGISMDEAMLSFAISKNTQSFITHRLDKNTTGAMIFAKNISFAQEIGKLFQNQEIKKAYIAILEGFLPQKQYIDAKIDDKHAISVFVPILYLSSQTLCMVFMKFGRKHQIRIHASLLGHPLYGDHYGGGEGKIFLHCFLLSFFQFTFFTQVPKRFYSFIRKNSENNLICFEFLMKFYYENKDTLDLLI